MNDILLVSFGLFSLCFFALAVYIYFREKRMRSNLLDDIFEASQYGKVLFDARGVFLKANARAEHTLFPILNDDIYDITQEEFIDSLYDHAADFDEILRNTLLGELKNLDEHSFREVVYSKENGLCLVVGCPLNDHYTLFTLTDINTGQAREADLLQLDKINRHLFHAIQAATSGIIISDPKVDGNPILFSNKAFYEFTGCDSDDLRVGHWHVLTSFFDDAFEKEAFIHALSTYEDAELSLQKSDGVQTYHYNLKLAPVYDSDGALDLYVGIMADVTLLKQRESEFFHAQKLKSLGQLAAGVAHDFNNVLSIINGYGMMISKLLDDDQNPIVGYVEKITSAADRGAGLTRKMLTFSKHKVVNRNVIDLCEMTREQSELLEPLLAGKVELRLSLPEAGLNIRGNEDSFGQILMNLAINARDAMPDGGVIEIGVDACVTSDVPVKVCKKVEADEYVRLFVRDTGTGMDGDTVAKIFDPFFSTKEQGKGTGLGLSVVYGLVNEMSGVMDVSSVVGQGTVFSVYFPRSFDEKTRNISGDLTDISSVRLDGYVVMVVEDEVDLLNIVTTMLQDIGMTVLAASNGNDALYVREEYEGEVDLILTDVMMPEMDGVKLSELMEALYPGTPVVFMSGYPASGDMAPVEIPQDVPFIAKPVDYGGLIRVLFHVLTRGSADAGRAGMSHWASNDTHQIQESGEGT